MGSSDRELHRSGTHQPCIDTKLVFFWVMLRRFFPDQCVHDCSSWIFQSLSISSPGRSVPWLILYILRTMSSWTMCPDPYTIDSGTAAALWDATFDAGCALHCFFLLAWYIFKLVSIVIIVYEWDTLFRAQSSRRQIIQRTNYPGFRDGLKRRGRGTGTHRSGTDCPVSVSDSCFSQSSFKKLWLFSLQPKKCDGL